MIEKSFVMLKPGYAEEEVLEELVKKLTARGLKVHHISPVVYDKEHARKHYAEHVHKSFYPSLEEYITSGTCIGMIAEGENAIATVRDVVAPQTEPGKFRHDIMVKYGIDPVKELTRNVVHASDKLESAEKEMKIYFDAANINLDKKA